MQFEPHNGEQMAFRATSSSRKMLTSVCRLLPLMAFKSQGFSRKKKKNANVYSCLHRPLFAYNCFLSQHTASRATLIAAIRPN